MSAGKSARAADGRRPARAVTDRRSSSRACATFLIAWLAARHGGGRVILRIEDLDRSRARADAAQTAIEDIRWLGLDWDEGPDIGGPSGPYLQSARSEVYAEVLETLKRTESVYPCTCTRADVARAAGAPHMDDEGPAYPGTCSHRCAGDAKELEHLPFAWRFRVPPGVVEWDDLFLGRAALDPARLGGDFIIAQTGLATPTNLQLSSMIISWV